VKKRSIFCLLIFALVILPLLAACAGEATPTPTATAPAPTATAPAPTATAPAPTATAPAPTATAPAPTAPAPAGANWWDKFGEPEYGGTITFRRDQIQFCFDPKDPFNYCTYTNEPLFVDNWVLDRNIWGFQNFFNPEPYLQPLVAESWEWTDTQTATVHIRKGIHWQNKPPANGREFTAQDVQYHYDRMLGTGSGFTEPLPIYLGFGAGAIKKVTATDDYTAVFEFKTPGIFTNSQAMIDVINQFFELPELVASGGIDDWKNAVGIGAYMLTDYSPDVSATCVKNPDYWGVDERHPENRIPYIDTVRTICIPDTATAVAALRTGKVDLLDNLQLLYSQSLKKNSPEIQQIQIDGANLSLMMRVDREPFTDINVRKAMQLALDLKTIAQTHYKGVVSGQPSGTIYPKFTGWCYPYDEWSQDLKDGRTYNPTKAKQLLADAGYPNGFKTNAVAASNGDIDLMQIVKAYLMDIGVDMEIRLMDFVSAGDYTRSGKHDQMAFAQSNNPHIPAISFMAFATGSPLNSCRVSDPTFDAMYANFGAATTMDEAKQLSREMDKYYLEHYWRADLFPAPNYIAFQPYLKGYSGEVLHYVCQFYWARLWIDQDLKESMGR
jgi:peptide/nickel transport system substrate-binding protein